MNLTGAEIIVQLLERQGISILAGIPGGANLPLYNALHKSKIHHVLTRHEQAAGFIAQGMARSSGTTAVCFATSGPGATNLLTAIADAKLDSVPVVAITGQVPSQLIGTDAFQEIDTYGMTIPITKHNFLVRSVEELFTVIPEAFRIAASGRPGPVLIDVPKDIQSQRYEFSEWPEPGKTIEIKIDNSKEIDKAIDMLTQSKKPVLYVGGGIIHSNASEELLAFAHKNSIPVTPTLMALGAIPYDDPLCLGMLGMHGSQSTNIILNEADLVLALGVRFDDRATGKVSGFCPNATIIHADIDSSEFDKIKKVDLCIGGNIKEILTKLLEKATRNERRDWINTVSAYKKQYPFPKTFPKDLLHPFNIIRTVDSVIAPDSIITTDVGQHQMWVAQYYPFKKPRTLLTSGGLGTMGFGLPTALGAAFANPSKRIVCFSGDGSILMNIQELATLADYNLDVTVVLFNNGHLGLVRQQQELFYTRNYIASKFITNPDFKTIANGFGIRSFDLAHETDVRDVLSRALTEKGPSFVNVPIAPDLNVLPMVPPGGSNTESIGE
ncbi:MAG: biosynthetic-type acetolactate synthase large subunit [Fibrobacter sp.]|nr:biosynthetic-type acetolactate synthase large subunit [Fibrobacter sp.]